MDGLPVVLITGASSGIGRETATLLVKKGYRVYGTSRNPKKADLPKGIEFIAMELSDEGSVVSCVEYVLQREGRIDILINNAGYGLAGAVEDTARQEAEDQFSVNFFGPFSVIKAVLPAMRRVGRGKIINVGSVAGFIPIPFQAFYSASKFALEAMSLALGLEVKPFGIDVTIVEPGDLSTGFTSSRVYANKTQGESPYKGSFEKSISTMIKDETKGPPPKVVSNVILKLIGMKNPPSKVVPGAKYKVFSFIKRVIPQRLLEYILIKLY